MTTRNTAAFGSTLRKTRSAKGITLRAFAAMVGVSPAYLSQVEQGNIEAPTAERIKRMAELLDVNADTWTALAGRIPGDLQDIIKSKPSELPELLRVAGGLTSSQIQALTDQARRLSRKAR